MSKKWAFGSLICWAIFYDERNSHALRGELHLIFRLVSGQSDPWFKSGAPAGVKQKVIHGVGKQDKIGVLAIDIEKKVDGEWQYHDTLDSIDHPEFFTYNSYDHVGAVDFYGTPGVTYRVTLLVYTKKGSGSDTDTITSPAVACK